MQAMVLQQSRHELAPLAIAEPAPKSSELLIRVGACGVCRTDLHIVDGDLPNPKLPLVPGHEIVGTVVRTGSDVERYTPGNRVGVPWLGKTCDTCSYCTSGRENLCAHAQFTGYDMD